MRIIIKSQIPNNFQISITKILRIRSLVIGIYLDLGAWDLAFLFYTNRIWLSGSPAGTMG